MTDVPCWPRVRLSELLTFYGSGATPRGGKNSYKMFGVPLVRSMNVHDLCFEQKDLAFIDEAQAGMLDRVQIIHNDILLNITGASVARCCLATSSAVGGRVNQHVMILRTDPSFGDARWLARALAGPYKGKLLAIAGSGATREALTKSDVKNFIISLPPLEYQRRIADLLDVYERLIENNRRRIEILEEMARLLYREWFVHFRYPGHEDVELVNSDFGPIPKGWGQTCLADELELQRFNFKPFEYADEEFDHYSIPAFDARKLPSLERGAEIKSSKYLLFDESVMISKLNPRFPRVWRVDRSETDRQAVASTEFLVLANPVKWTLTFVYSLATSTEFVNRLVSTAGGTSTSHQRVKPTDVMNMPVVNPQAEIVQRYSEQVRPFLRLVDNFIQQNQILQEARDLLLPRLVSGELDVSDLDLQLETLGYDTRVG
ncbi:MAG: restriction endonuclease subunit S [Acidimicrobiaceae bacterium]|nr:restriction endonuclease subunit S [Acidimicrobiaceae bacterium]